MKGMDSLIALRRAGKKPACVFVELVGRYDESAGLACTTTDLTVQVRPDERIASLDLRPLVGCRVAVADYAYDPDRHLDLFNRVAEAKPSSCWTTFDDGERFTLHTRSAPKYETEEARC